MTYVAARGANRSWTWDPGGIQLAARAGAALVVRACCTPGGRGHTGARLTIAGRRPGGKATGRFLTLSLRPIR